MSNLVIGSNTYQNIDFLRVFNSNGDVAQAPIIAETPEGVTLLKYLDTTGAGSVDLGRAFAHPSTGSSLQMKFGILDATSVQIVFTSGTHVIGAYRDQLVILNSKLRMDRENDGNAGRFPLDVGNDILYSSFTKTGNDSWSIGSNLSTGASYSAKENATMYDIADPAHNMILFAEYNNNVYQTFATVRFYELCYREGGVDVMHLYPAIDSNGVKCLYDSVSQECIYSTNGAFENQGA